MGRPREGRCRVSDYNESRLALLARMNTLDDHATRQAMTDWHEEWSDRHRPEVEDLRARGLLPARKE